MRLPVACLSVSGTALPAGVMTDVATLPSRRALLLTLASATLAGCRGLPWSRVAARPSAAAAPVDMEVWGEFSAGVLTAFERAYPNVRLAETGSATTRYRLWYTLSGGEGGNFADLTAALRELNFQPSALLSGTMAPWTYRGRTFGIPVSCIPWGVAWRTDAFAAARIPPPAPDWTYDDFHNACTELQALAASGRVQGLRAALGPIALAPPGGATIPAGMFPGPKGWVFAPALALAEGLWQAFVWGFGAAIAHAGRFALTAPATVAALQTLVDLAREFCVPAEVVAAVPVVPDHTAWLTAIQNLFALQFVLYYGASRPAPWAWARLPRFPVEAVIPIVSSGVALSMNPPSAPPPSQAPAALAAAEFGVWLNSEAALDVRASSGMVPAVAAAGIQSRFWGGPSPGPAAVLGDWRNFRGVYDGFPALSSGYAIVGSTIARALSGAMTGTSSLPTALADAEQRMNAALLQ